MCMRRHVCMYIEDRNINSIKETRTTKVAPKHKRPTLCPTLLFVLQLWVFGKGWVESTHRAQQRSALQEGEMTHINLTFTVVNE